MARKISTVVGRVAAGLAALSMVAAASGASADSRRYYDRHHHRGNNNSAEAAIVAGVVGLALGAALAGNNNDRYARPGRGYDDGYGPPPPPPPRYYGRGYERDYRSDCWVTRDYDRRSGVVYERTVCR